MSQLNLVPDPIVLAAHAGVFVATIAIVKKLYVEPYLKLRDRRESLTTGSQQDSKNILQRCEEISSQINVRLKEASVEVNKIREESRRVATLKREDIVKKAEAEMKTALAQLEKSVKEELMTERTKIQNVVLELSKEVFTKVTTH